VARIEPAAISQSISRFMWGHGHAFHELLEARKLFEVEIAGLVAERATEDDIAQVDRALGQMAASLPEVHTGTASLERFVQADWHFHQIMAKASKNTLLPVLPSPISDPLVEFRRRASSLPGAPENAVHFHRTLLQSVRDHNRQVCRMVMSEHLTNAENYLDQLDDQSVTPH
jgi:GntR family transcriptional repressor for pyruvate dehydrogenase complex